MDRQRDLVTGKTLARIGLGLLLLGIVFLYRWGVEENLITEEARVGVGVALSFGLLAVGWATRLRQALFSALLQGGGIAGLFVTSFAAHARYELTSETSVFIQLVFVSGLAIGLAVYQRIESLAVVGVIAALIAPKMVPGSIDVFPGDAGYVAVVLVAVGVLLYLYDWRILHGATMVTAGVSFAIELGDVLGEWSFSPAESLIAYGAALAALWGAPIARLIDRRPQNAEVAMVATVAVPLGVAAAAWQAWDRPVTEAAGVVAIGLAAVMAAAYVILRANEPFVAVLHLLPASVFSLSAVALILDGPALTVGLAAHGVGLALVGRRLELDPMEILGWTLYGLTGVWTAMQLVTESGAVPVFNGESLSRLGVIALGAAVGGHLMRETDVNARTGGSILLGYAHIGFLAWSLTELARTDIGQPLASATWGIYSLMIISLAWGRSRLARNVGLGTLLLTVTKVFLVDMDNSTGGAKILLLMGFGLALLALGYLMPNERDDEPGHGADGTEVDPTWDAPTPEEAPLSHV